MADELVSFCIRKGMAKFCKFFIGKCIERVDDDNLVSTLATDKKYGTIDNFLLDHNMDQFVGEPSIDPVEKALFMEKINEFVESRDNNNNKSYLATSSVKQHPVDVRCSDQPKRDNGTRLKVNQVGKFDLHEYSPNPEGRNIYEVNKSKSFDSVVDGVFYISKYRIPDTWSSAAIANFLTDGANVKSCKQFVDLIKAISGDLYPYLSEMFIYEMPRHILSGVCSIFAQKYPHLDDLYLHLKQTDPETSDKYVRAYKVFIDVSVSLNSLDSSASTNLAVFAGNTQGQAEEQVSQSILPYQGAEHVALPKVIAQFDVPRPDASRRPEKGSRPNDEGGRRVDERARDADDGGRLRRQDCHRVFDPGGAGRR